MRALVGPVSGPLRPVGRRVWVLEHARKRLRAFSLDNVTASQQAWGMVRSCGAVVAHCCCGPPLPRALVATGAPLARGWPRRPRTPPRTPYRGVRGVRGSTVGGAHTAHARPARFHARFPVGPIAPVGSHAFEAGCEAYREREIDELELQGGRVYLHLGGPPRRAPAVADSGHDRGRPRPGGGPASPARRLRLRRGPVGRRP
jgi:hypothetical protein